MITIFAAADKRLLSGLLVAVALVLFAVFLVASALSSRRRRMEVPHALRPGPSDEELETRSLPRFLSTGAVFLLLLSFGLPAYWLREPTRIRLKEEQFKRESIHRGETIYQAPKPGSPHFAANCARCHGAQGEGAVQPFKEKLRVAEPPLGYIVDRYKEAGRNDDEIRQLIVDAIERGRPGTVMPTWGLAFGGPLNTQQVDDVVNYIYSIQKPIPRPAGADGRALFEANCSTCHTKPPGKDKNGATITYPVGSGGYGPDLRAVLSQYTPDEVFSIIHDGRINYNRPSMPTWAFLGDAAIKSIIDFLKTIQIGPAKTEPTFPSSEPSPSTSSTAAPNRASPVPTQTGAQ